MLQIANLASSEYGASRLLLAAVSMGSDFTYVPNTGAVTGVMAALTVLTGIVNSLSTYWVGGHSMLLASVRRLLTGVKMEKITRLYIIFHIGALLTCKFLSFPLWRGRFMFGIYANRFNCAVEQST